MKKRFVKMLLASVLTIAIVLSAIGCVKKENVDTSKTQLRIFAYDAGVGTVWLDNFVERFEAKYAETSFEEGKLGVQVLVRKSPDSQKLDLIASATDDIFFVQGLNYGQAISKEYLLDLTDIVTESLSGVTGGDEEGSIADKIDENYLAALTGVNGKHHIIPWYETYSGLTYDKKVFSDQSLYIKEGIASGVKFTGVESEKSVGPDGIRNTYDDGLPSSYEEFYALLDQAVKKNVIPMVWTGRHSAYTNMLIAGGWAAMSGKDQLLLSVNFDSNATGKTVYNETLAFDSNGNPTVSKDIIDKSNGYLTTQQAGKYYPYEFFHKVLSDSRYYSNKINSTFGHLHAHEAFIYSDLDDRETPIAMMIEGSYWYNEAENAEIFLRSEKEFRDEAKNRDFAWMPMPVQAEGQVAEGGGKKNTVVSSLNAMCFANAKVKNKPAVLDLTKKFLQQLYSDKELQEFTNDTKTFMGVNYKMLPQQIEKFTKFSQSLYTIRENSDVVYPYSSSKIFLNNFARLGHSQDLQVWWSTVGGQTYQAPYDPFRFNNNVTARIYFENTKITKSDWDAKYNI